MTATLSRRAFVGAALSAGALSRIAPSTTAEAAPQRPARLTLGVASYSCRKFTLDQTLEMAKALGITPHDVQGRAPAAHRSAETTRALRAKIEAAGITIMGGGTIDMPNNPAEIRKAFEYAKNAGLPLIYISPEPAALDTIEPMAKEFDIKAAIHNHGPEDKHWPRPQDAYTAIKSRDKQMGLCIDIGHTTRTGTDPVQACRQFRDRLYDMHVKDLAVKTDKDSQVEVGRGVLDFPGALQDAARDRLPGPGRPRVPDQGRRSAAGDDRVDRVHARRAGRGHDPLIEIETSKTRELDKALGCIPTFSSSRILGFSSPRFLAPRFHNSLGTADLSVTAGVTKPGDHSAARRGERTGPVTESAAPG